jgi:hypothetical protein
MRQALMNAAPQYHSCFVCVALLQSKMRNGMEEVAGSIPARSTNLSVADVDGSQANLF